MGSCLGRTAGYLRCSCTFMVGRASTGMPPTTTQVRLSRAVPMSFVDLGGPTKDVGADPHWVGRAWQQERSVMLANSKAYSGFAVDDWPGPRSSTPKPST